LFHDFYGFKVVFNRRAKLQKKTETPCEKRRNFHWSQLKKRNDIADGTILQCKTAARWVKVGTSFVPTAILLPKKETRFFCSALDFSSLGDVRRRFRSAAEKEL